MPRALELHLRPAVDPLLPENAGALALAAARALRVEPSRLAAVRVRRVSFDARRRHRDWLARVDVYTSGEPLPDEPLPSPPRIAPPPASARHVVVVGAGPAGLFATLGLLERGVRVTLLDRGGDVRERRKPLADLNRGAGADPESNYCFGEGGAGTYSDGKLYARSGSKAAVRAVLETLVAHGAPPEILVSWRPHIGSNRLPQVVQRLRETLVAGGATVRFGARVDELLTAPGVDRPRVTGVGLTARGERERIDCDAVVLAAGHSAFDTLRLAQRAGARLEPKGFALGVRVEHPQAFVDAHQYGGLRDAHALPAAFYELTTQVEGRGVYSFCMCPGGWIVPATTAADRVVVNGMSLSRRDSPFANSGIVVQLEPEDWCGERAAEWGFDALDLDAPIPARPDDDPLFGARLQLAIERRAALAGGGANRCPSERVDAFVERAAAPPPAIACSYRPGTTPVDLHALLPRGVAERLRRGLVEFDARIPGFVSELAQLHAPESRTSSPVRIARDRETSESPTLAGLFPAGEGAGFAGGIVSAALDGGRVAGATSGAAGGRDGAL